MHPAIDEFFKQIPMWMERDIFREIQLARLTADAATKPQMLAWGIAGGGNLLAALGLVSYTEALGRVKFWNRARRQGGSEETFLEFFDAMEDGRYKAWRLAWEASHPTTTLYESLRCGLVHEYQPKVDSAFWIGDGHDFGLDEQEGVLIFKVEPFYRHFGTARQILEAQLRSDPNAEIPEPKLKGVAGAKYTQEFRATPSVEPPRSTPTVSPTSGPPEV